MSSHESETPWTDINSGVVRHAIAVDQLGTATITPNGEFEAGSKASFTLTYTAGLFGIDDSGSLRVCFRFASDQSNPQFDDPAGPNYTTVEASNGAVLQVRWDVGSLPMRVRIPNLTIQPLLENAIYHGIELLADGGEVLVSGKRDGKCAEISMSNPVAEGRKRDKSGNNMALANIRQRFELAYGNRGSVLVDDSGSRYSVTLRFPLEEVVR